MTRINALTIAVIALVLAMAVFGIVLLSDTNTLSDAQDNLAGQQQRLTALAQEAQQTASQTQALVSAGRHQRLLTTAAICKQTNALARKLKALIIAGTESTRAFEKKLRRLGFPPFRVRLRQAIRQARSLDLVDCAPLNH